MFQMTLPGWAMTLNDWLANPLYGVPLFNRIQAAYNLNRCTPAFPYLFTAYDSVDYPEVRVVLLTQDPYPTPGHAVGIATAVPARIQPSDYPGTLRNIFAEVFRLFGAQPPNGELRGWLEQGVLPLNMALSTVENEIGKHLAVWKPFTEYVLRQIAKLPTPVVYIAHGNPAIEAIDQLQLPKHHTVLKTTHPSDRFHNRASGKAPAFTGSGCYARANAWLIAHGVAPIDWTR